jgi:hypothetical protein
VPRSAKRKINLDFEVAPAAYLPERFCFWLISFSPSNLERGDASSPLGNASSSSDPRGAPDTPQMQDDFILEIGDGILIFAE